MKLFIGLDLGLNKISRCSGPLDVHTCTGAPDAFSKNESECEHTPSLAR